MSIDVVSNVVQMVVRVEGALVFTVVRFLYGLMQGKLDAGSIALFAFVLSFLAYDLQLMSGGADSSISFLRTLHYITGLVKKFATLIAIQAIIQNVQPPDLESASLFQQIQCFSVSLSILILVCVLPESFKDSEDGQQFFRLVLYMFASNTQFIVQRVSFGWTLPYLSMAGFFTLYRLQNSAARSPISETVFKALTLSLTNMMILSSWTVTVSSTDKLPQLIQLVSLLVIFDALSKVYGEFLTMRDYAVWQGASQVYDLILLKGVDQVPMIAIAFFIILFLQAVQGFFPSSNAITELSVLLIINIVLGMVKGIITSLHSSDTIIIIVIWIIIIQVFVLAMKSLRSG